MNIKQRRRAKWLFWGLFFAFYTASLIATIPIERALGRNIWIEGFLKGAASVVGMLGAGLLVTIFQRRRGLSRETWFEMEWPNTRREEDAPVATAFLRHMPQLRWLMLGCGLLMLALIGGIYFGIPADKQIGREIVPPMALFIALGVAWAFAFFSLPLVRVNTQGVRTMFGRTHEWHNIAACRVEIQRNIFGDLMPPTVSVLGHGDKRLTLFRLEGTKEKQHDLLLALHNAMQPHEEAPDLMQVLEADVEHLSST